MPFVPYGSLSQQPPDEYDLAASLQSPEPVINPGPKTASGTKVFGVAAKQNIGGAAGGLLGAAGAGFAMGSFFPGAGNIVGAGVGLGGALLGSYLGNEAQAAIDPTYEEDAQWLAEQYPEHKYSAIAGTLAPNLIGMRPSLAPLKQLGTIRGTLAKQKAGGALGGSSWRNLTAEQQNAILNVGAGVGLGVAPSVNNLVQGRDVDIAELLAGVGSGAFITQPRKFMGRLGMHPSLSPEEEYAAIHDLVVAKSLQDAPAPVIPDQELPQIDPNALAQEELLQRGLRGFIAPTDLPGAPVPTVSDDGVLTLIKPSHTKSTITEEGKAKNVRVPAEQVGNPEALPIGYNLRAAKGSQKAAAEKAAMKEWEALLDAETRNKSEARKAARSEEQFSPGAEMRDEVPTMGEARAAEYLRATEKRQTPEYHEAYAKYGKLLRGVETLPQSEMPEAGRYTPRATGAEESTIETGQGRGFGTMPHELTHDAADFLRRSPRKQDNRLHDLTIEAIQNDPKYKAWKAAADEQNARKGWKYSTEPEEYWAREAGAAKDLRVFDETPEVRNQRDRETATRVVDGTASVDDYVRYANNLMQYGPSFQTVMQRYGGKFGQLNAPIQQSSIGAQTPDDTDKLPADSFKAKALGLEPGATLAKRRAAMKGLAQKHIENYPDAKVYEDYPKDFQNILNQLRGKGSASTQRDREMTAAKVETEALAAGKTAEEAKALAEAEKAASVRTRGFEPREWNAAAKAKVAEHTFTKDETERLVKFATKRIKAQNSSRNRDGEPLELTDRDAEHLARLSLWDFQDGRWSEPEEFAGKMPNLIAKTKPNTQEFTQTAEDQLYRIGDRQLAQWRKENKKLGTDIDEYQVDTEGRAMRLGSNEDEAALSPEVEARNYTAEERDLRDIYEKSLDPESRYYTWTAAPEEFNRAFLNLQKRMGLFRNFGIHEINAFKRRLLNPFDESAAKVSARHRDELGKFQLAAEEVWNMPQDEQTAFLSGWRKRVQQNTKLTSEAKLAAVRAVDDLAKQFEQRWHPMNRVELEQQAKELAAEKAFKRKYGTQYAYEPSKEVPISPKKETLPKPLRDSEYSYEEQTRRLEALPGINARLAKLERGGFKLARDKEEYLSLRDQRRDILSQTEREVIEKPAPQRISKTGKIETVEPQINKAESIEAQSKRDLTQEMRDEDIATDQYSPAAAVPDSPEFKRWFGDSKVVDENGKPKVVYHGTNRDFNKFDPEKLASRPGLQNKFVNRAKQGFSFSSDPVHASIYGMRYRGETDRGTHLYYPQDGSNIKSVFLRIEKPDLIRTKYNDTTVRLSKESDGAIITFSDDPSVEYVVKTPEQIKSATGNSGAFDPNNPDIRYSPAAAVPDSPQQRAIDERFERIKNTLPTDRPRTREEIVAKLKNMGPVEFLRNLPKWGWMRTENSELIITPKGYSFARPEFTMRQADEYWRAMEQVPVVPKPQHSISSMVPDLFKAEIDLVKRLDPDLGKAFERADRSRARLTGYLNNEPLHLLQNELALKPEGRDNKTFLKDLLANDSPDHRYVMWYRDQIMNGKKPSVTLTPRQQRINEAVELILKRTYDEREKNPLTKHDTKQTPGYLPGMMDLKIAREIEVNRSGKIAQDAIKAQEDWLAAEYGRGSKEFKDRMGRFLGAFDKKQMNSAEQFGPIDLNEGVGLAPELRDKNLNRLMSRFARRFAERMAFANEVQADKKAMARLQDDKVSLKSNPHVKNVLDRMNGVTEEQEEVRMAISGAIRSMMLQTKTGLGDVTTSFPITMKHLSAKQLGGAGMAWARGAYEGLTRKGDLFRETLRQGINVDNSTTMEMGEDTSKNIANVLNGVRNITNKATGRNWLEQISRAGVYEEGKWLATENVKAVLDGTANAQQKKFVDDFFDKPEFTPEAIKEAATRFVETNQGTYGYRGLPSISEKGSTAPFLALSRWNIEQMNNFDKFVFQPALKGNYEPLLMATLGALIGGAAVEQLYEIVSNRKSRLPTVSEIGASKQPVKGTLYKLAGLASLSGFAGFYGDIARTVGDVNFGNRAQGLTNPLWNGMQDFAGIVSDFTMAVADGNIEDAVTQIFPVLLQTYVQDARLLMAHADDAEMNRRDSFRDVRMFNALNEGSVTRAIADQPNPFTNVGLRKFKKTSDLSEAAELLPGLLEGAVGRSGGDPEKIDQEFGKLKANSYQTMPSPQRRPLEFARYMEYLTKTQGPEAAAERFVDYQKQNAINQAKTAMVP